MNPRLLAAEVASINLTLSDALGGMVQFADGGEKRLIDVALGNLKPDTGNPVSLCCSPVMHVLNMPVLSFRIWPRVAEGSCLERSK